MMKSHDYMFINPQRQFFCRDTLHPHSTRLLHISVCAGHESNTVS